MFTDSENRNNQRSIVLQAPVLIPLSVNNFHTQVINLITILHCSAFEVHILHTNCEHYC